LGKCPAGFAGTELQENATWDLGEGVEWTAVFIASGTLCAKAKATWIELPPDS
jgi:hypothetical protein